MSKEYDESMIKYGVTFNFPCWQFSEEDGRALFELSYMSKHRPIVIYEIGCWTGHSTYWLAQIAKRNKGFVRTIDTFGGEGSFLKQEILGDKRRSEEIKRQFLKNIKLLGMADYVKLINMPAQEASISVSNDYIDFMFIDGSHKYEDISKDIENWWPKIRGGGIMCGHDCEQKDWNELLINEDAVDGIHHGVIKAVFEKFPEAQIINNKIWWIMK